jgi:hypothetical protein
MTETLFRTEVVTARQRDSQDAIKVRPPRMGWILLGYGITMFANLRRGLLLAGALLLQLPVMAQTRPPYVIKINRSENFDQALHDQLIDQRKAASSSLDSNELASFRELILRSGWPTVTSVGQDGVDAAGDLMRLATDDYKFQDALEQIVGNRVGIDIDGLAFARLVDNIEFSHDGSQQFGTLLRLNGTNVVPSPPVPETFANTARDFTGLPLLQDYLAAIQTRVDRGLSLDKANPIPRLSTPSFKLTDPSLRQQLYGMITQDQASRSAFMKDGMKADSPLRRKIQDVDRQNLVSLKAIFAKSGFPTVQMIGRDGVSTVFLLVQHADEDHAFQKHALDLAKPLMERNELARAEYAMLVDRVRLADGKMQLYGSQVKMDGGEAQPFPVEDPDHLDSRRRSMALPPEAQYLAQFRTMGRH